MSKYQYWLDWKGGHMVDTNLKRLGQRFLDKFPYLYEPNAEALKTKETQWQHNLRVLRVADYKYLRANVFGRYSWLSFIKYPVNIMDFDTPLFGCFEYTITIIRINNQ